MDKLHDVLVVTWWCLAIVSVECGVVHGILTLTGVMTPGSAPSNGFLVYLLATSLLAVAVRKRLGCGPRFVLRLSENKCAVPEASFPEKGTVDAVMGTGQDPSRGTPDRTSAQVEEPTDHKGP